MKLKKQLQSVLKKYNCYEGILLQLASPYALHQMLAPGSPYLSEDPEAGAAPGYVEQCVQIAVQLYESLAFGKQLLVVYEDMYGEENLEEIAFVESCLIEWETAEHDIFSWKHQPMEGDYPAARDANEGSYTCTRRLYGAKSIDAKRLFREIILSDIGGRYGLASRVFVIDTESACIFHLYDDRGIAIYAPEEALLSHIGTEHDDVPEEC